MNFTSVRHRLLKQRRFRQLLVGSFSLALFLGIVIVPIEFRNQSANILTLSDGLWWSVQTLTTVGYGDVVPVTDTGRLLGFLLQIVGTLMFGTLIAFISSSMSRNQEEFYWSRLFERIDRLEGKINDLEKQSKYMVKGNVPEKDFNSSPPDRSTDDTLG